MFKVTKWDEDSSVPFSQEETDESSSIREDADDSHALLLDLDVPAWLIPSSTEGHSHLYVDVKIPSRHYWPLLDALADAGVIQRGYANSSKHRGGTALRLPWVKKGEPSDIAPTPAVVPAATPAATTEEDPF